MASALEQFVNSVPRLSAQGQMTQLCELINKSGELLAKNLSHLDTVLGALDVQEHSLGVLAVLFVKFSMPSVPDLETLFSQVRLFISTCNGEHIRYATDTFAGLCHQLTNALVERKQPLRGIVILKQAIDKMQLNTNQLTSIHADLCQLCLLAKCFKPALPYLDVDMMDICKENGAYDAKHFFCYYYYGGMIYTGLKNFERALYFYEQAITTPAMAVSHIMLESYKKYILVSLILLGKVQQLPKYTSQIVGRFIKPLSNVYHELAQVYSTNNPLELQNLVNKHSETFTRDNNMGLEKQFLSSLYKKNIQRLTKASSMIEELQQYVCQLKQQLQESQIQTKEQLRDQENKFQMEKIHLKHTYEKKIIDIRREYETKLKGLMPASLRQELEDTISSLKSQINFLQKKVSILQEKLLHIKAEGTAHKQVTARENAMDAISRLRCGLLPAGLKIWIL
ncbi:LOW QUALITY PROTEIN: COP9 signalosome complex subunit 3-like [Symphalangus syndactylus]|uniref:LOW QUALITY PROTEIN: COP9 signalosome complex subunit 3-like n=1 Tax=Symphalangus syndactylus TaxID=9590 RepID=UPI003007D9B2